MSDDEQEATRATQEQDTDQPTTPEGDAGAGRAPSADGEAEDAVEPVEDRQGRRDERWRERARTAEQTAERLATKEVLRLLGQRVSDAQLALAVSGIPVSDLLTDGDVDEQAVAALAVRLIEQHPALRQHGHPLDLGVKPTVRASRGASWNTLLDKQRRP